MFFVGFVHGSGKSVEISVSSNLSDRLADMGLSHAIGFLRFSKNCSAKFEYVPFQVFLGIPLEPLELCNAVCALARELHLIDPAKAEDIIVDQQRHTNIVDTVMKQFIRNAMGMAPTTGFIFDGHKLCTNDSKPLERKTSQSEKPNSQPKAQAILSE